MISLAHAEQVARTALEAEGETPSAQLQQRTLSGGWRFWAVPADGVLGGVHVLVSSAGGVRAVSAGMLDSVAEGLLAQP